jgi:hypothetical protein
VARDAAHDTILFSNRTGLSTDRLRRMCLQAVASWRIGRIIVRVRYSRGADFSGSCYYRDGRIFINLGRHLRYPYQMGTHVARSVTTRRRWWKPVYKLELADPYQVVLFVFLHEIYHWLVKRARRNIRRKESMCDRFAARILVDRYAAVVRDWAGQPVPRESWDFQNVEGFIAAVRRKPAAALPRRAATRPRRSCSSQQLMLFEL